MQLMVCNKSSQFDIMHMFINPYPIDGTSLWSMGNCEDNIDAVLQLLQRMKENNVRRDSTTFAAALSACDRLAAPDAAIALLSEMEVRHQQVSVFPSTNPFLLMFVHYNVSGESMVLV